MATDDPTLTVAPTGTSGLLQVTVSSTWSNWDESDRAVLVGGYVTGVTEAGGTCTLTLTKDGDEVTGHSTAEPDASTTSCGDLRATGGALAPGEWTAVLGYSSDRAAGTSAPFTVVVP